MRPKLQWTWCWRRVVPSSLRGGLRARVQALVAVLDDVLRARVRDDGRQRRRRQDVLHGRQQQLQVAACTRPEIGKVFI